MSNTSRDRFFAQGAIDDEGTLATGFQSRSGSFFDGSREPGKNQVDPRQGGLEHEVMNKSAFLLLILASVLTACGLPTKRVKPDPITPATPPPVVESVSAPNTNATPTPAPAPEPPAGSKMAEKNGIVQAEPDVSEMQIVLKTASGQMVKAPAPRQKIESQASLENASTPPSLESEVESVLPPLPTAVMSEDLVPTASQGRKAGPISAEKALGWLKNGNTRFVKGFLRKDGQSAKDRKRLLTGEKPHALILSSPDSRIPPEIIFDQKLGEIFVVRTGHLDTGSLGSIEKAVEALGVNLVVVLGHSQQQDAWSKISQVRGELLESSASLRDAARAGGVKVLGALYRLEDGKVEWNSP